MANSAIFNKGIKLIINRPSKKLFHNKLLIKSLSTSKHCRLLNKTNGGMFNCITSQINSNYSKSKSVYNYSTESTKGIPSKNDVNENI